MTYTVSQRKNKIVSLNNPIPVLSYSSNKQLNCNKPRLQLYNATYTEMCLVSKPIFTCCFDILVIKGRIHMFIMNLPVLENTDMATKAPNVMVNQTSMKNVLRLSFSACVGGNTTVYTTMYITLNELFSKSKTNFRETPSVSVWCVQCIYIYDMHSAIIRVHVGPSQQYFTYIQAIRRSITPIPLYL